MKATDYIRPTKANPIFIAECNYFGFIEDGNLWKEYEMETRDGLTGGYTWEIYYEKAIIRLHNWLKENKEAITEYPKAKYTIYLLDGSLDKRGERKLEKVYEITTKKAIQLL